MRAKIGGENRQVFARIVKRVRGKGKNEMELRGPRRYLPAVMVYPAVRILRACCAATILTAVALAEEPAGEPTKVTEAPRPKPERAVSPRVADLLAASTHQFVAAKPTEKPTASAAPTLAETPANEILRLPNFVVREPRVPTVEDIRTPRGLQVYAMNKYLGRPDGFSRGVLNRFTLAKAWETSVKHVPILNRFEWATSPEKRALDMYYDDEVRKKMRDLYALKDIREEPLKDSAKEKTTPAPSGAVAPADKK